TARARAVRGRVRARARGRRRGRARARPHALFDSLFSGFNQPPPNTSVLAYRRQSYDVLLSRFAKLAGSGVLSSADTVPLQAHADMLRDLKTNVLNQVKTSGCVPNTIGPVGSLVQRHETNGDTLAAAFACNLTRIVCYVMNAYDDNGAIGWGDDHGNS